MVTNLIVVLISQYVRGPNNYVVYLNLIFGNNISVKLEKICTKNITNIYTHIYTTF